jgi:hypothetical protein
MTQDEFDASGEGTFGFAAPPAAGSVFPAPAGSAWAGGVEAAAEPAPEAFDYGYSRVEGASDCPVEVLAVPAPVGHPDFQQIVDDFLNCLAAQAEMTGYRQDHAVDADVAVFHRSGVVDPAVQAPGLGKEQSRRFFASF